ncbi:hypothetical protein MXD59_16355 [Frankia sp. Ag45/Mut15]|uniref:Mycothiol-dependent maleylpyruvate isomerase metal-binding domain-containing protein n=2 Tax=Frankia umida TaxID=573489 RepID=A0ABT0K0L6_9ACTN|nr:hypothetical protein [Frankia umida]MCK9877328.1 hypothetical protein [Frankia umida]
MRAMSGGHVEEAVAEMVRVLGPHQDRDWQVQAGPVEWSCWKTAAHVAHDLLAYAGQVAARPTAGYLPFDLTVASDAHPREVLQVVTACGGLLGSVLAANPDTRAWHHGPTDATGFAAMGVAETLLHTHDITEGMGVRWRPPRSLCAGVLSRLFPGVPEGDPAQVLLWSTGRADLDGHSRRTSWIWSAAIS